MEALPPANPADQPQWISQDQWEQLRPTIIRLYDNENKTLPQLQVVLARDYGLKATDKMLKTRFKKWGLSKYYKGSEVEKIVQTMRQDQVEGRSRVHKINGQDVDTQKLHRSMMRRQQWLRQKVLKEGVEMALLPSSNAEHPLSRCPIQVLDSPEEYKMFEIIFANYSHWIHGLFSNSILINEGGDTRIYNTAYDSWHGEEMILAANQLQSCFELAEMALNNNDFTNSNIHLNRACANIKLVLDSNWYDLVVDILRGVILLVNSNSKSIAYHILEYVAELASVQLSSEMPLTRVLKTFQHLKANYLLEIFLKLSQLTQNLLTAILGPCHSEIFQVRSTSLIDQDELLGKDVRDEFLKLAEDVIQHRGEYAYITICLLKGQLIHYHRQGNYDKAQEIGLYLLGRVFEEKADPSAKQFVGEIFLFLALIEFKHGNFTVGMEYAKEAINADTVYEPDNVSGLLRDITFLEVALRKIGANEAADDMAARKMRILEDPDYAMLPS